MYSSPQIFGWMPTKCRDPVEIPPRPIPPIPSTIKTTFPLPEYNDASSITRSPSGYEAYSPASSSSSFFQEGDPPSDHTPRPVRGDPAWIARPRNPFIIFRCKFSKENSREGKRVRRPPGIPAEKTISKKAAEAWRLLPEEQKKEFVERAKLEKEEHARMYPDYKYKPKRGGPVIKKRGAKVSQPPSHPVEETPVIAPSPQYPFQSALPESPLIAYGSFLPEQPPPSPADIYGVKAGRRRSASAPSLPLWQSYVSGLSRFDEMPKLSTKRSRSAMTNRPLPLVQVDPPSPYGEPSFNSSFMESTISSGYYTPEESLGIGQNLSPAELAFPDYFYNDDSGQTSPLTTINPSLGAWDNGQNIPENPQVSPTWGHSSRDNLNDYIFPEYTYTQVVPGLPTYTSDSCMMSICSPPMVNPAGPGEILDPSLITHPLCSTEGEDMYALQGAQHGMESHECMDSLRPMTRFCPSFSHDLL